MTKLFNFVLNIKEGGREGGTCKVLQPCHPPPEKNLKCAPKWEKQKTGKKAALTRAISAEFIPSKIVNFTASRFPGKFLLSYYTAIWFILNVIKLMQSLNCEDRRQTQKLL